MTNHESWYPIIGESFQYRWKQYDVIGYAEYDGMRYEWSQYGHLSYVERVFSSKSWKQYYLAKSQSWFVENGQHVVEIEREFSKQTTLKLVTLNNITNTHVITDTQKFALSWRDEVKVTKVMWVSMTDYHEGELLKTYYVKIDGIQYAIDKEQNTNTYLIYQQLYHGSTIEKPQRNKRTKQAWRWGSWEDTLGIVIAIPLFLFSIIFWNTENCSCVPAETKTQSTLVSSQISWIINPELSLGSSSLTQQLYTPEWVPKYQNTSSATQQCSCRRSSSYGAWGGGWWGK